MKAFWWFTVLVVLVLVFAVSTSSGFGASPWANDEFTRCASERRPLPSTPAALPGYADQDLLTALRGSAISPTSPEKKDALAHERLALVFRRKAEELASEADRRARRQGHLCLDEISAEGSRSPGALLPPPSGGCDQAARTLRQAAEEMRALAIYHERLAQESATLETRI